MASIRERSRADGTTAYLVLYRMEDGRQGGLTFDDNRKATAFKIAVEAHGARRACEMHDVDPEPRRHSQDDMTVAQWIRRYIDHLTGVEQKTLDDYNRYLRDDIAPVLGDIPLTVLAEEDIAQWVKTMETTKTRRGGPPSPKTIKNKHGFLSGALGAAVKSGKIPANPAAGRRLPRGDGDDGETEMRMLSRDEFKALLSATPDYWQPLLEFLVTSGCRWGEVTALKPQDINRSHNTVRVRRAWKYSSDGYQIGPTKTRRSKRTINLPSRILEQLDYSHEWLFVNHHDSPVRYHRFIRVWNRAVRDAGLDPRPTPHDLRHTCASWMLAAGVPMMTVSRHLGHESINITADVYADVDRAAFAAAADVMSKLLE